VTLQKSALALRTDRATGLPQYERHEPEQTLLYQIIERHYPAFKSVTAAQGKPLLFPIESQPETADFFSDQSDLTRFVFIFQP